MKKSELNIKKGYLVKLTNTDNCYDRYIQYMLFHPWYSIRYAYKTTPDPSHWFRVLKISRHVLPNKFDKNEFCVVLLDIETKQIFLSGESAIIPV